MLNTIESVEKQKLTCTSCNTRIIIGSKTIKKLARVKPKAKAAKPNEEMDTSITSEHNVEKSQDSGVLNFLGKCFNAGLKAYDFICEEYGAADERLSRQGIDDWDEEKLQKERVRFDIFEGAIIRQKLIEKKQESS